MGVSRCGGSVACGAPPSTVKGGVIPATGLALMLEAVVWGIAFRLGERERAWVGGGRVASLK